MGARKVIRYYIVDAFSSQPFGGNPAGVVLLGADDFPSEGLMLQIAAELRFSETAFVKQLSDKEFHIRYFTPEAEVDVCGHATIAAFFLLHQTELAATGRCICRTRAGNLNVEAGNQVMMQMPQPRIIGTITETADIYRALGVSGYQPPLPVQVVSAGLPDIMLPLADVATLQALQPNMTAIASITKRYEAVSIHPFALSDDGYTAHVRDFAPLYGIPEESATGTANASLTHYLHHHNHLSANAVCTFIQGEAMGRPSVVATQIQPDGNILVGGTATVVAEGEMRV